MQKISIVDKEYNYTIRESKKAKYIKLQINEQGLKLILPVGVSAADGEKFIAKNRAWLEKHIGKYSSLPEEFFYLGHKINIEQKTDNREKHIKVEMLNTDNLIITSAPGRNIPVKKIFQVWLKNQARHIIPDRVMFLSKKYGFIAGKVTVRNQKTRWGSCSNNGNLSFNYNLLQFEPSVIDYVIVHELCHLKEMNHSKRFWNNVEVIIPNYKKIKNKLKKNINKV